MKKPHASQLGLTRNQMTRLSSEQVLKDNNTRDPSAVEALSLNHRALSDVRTHTSDPLVPPICRLPPNLSNLSLSLSMTFAGIVLEGLQKLGKA